MVQSERPIIQSSDYQRIEEFLDVAYLEYVLYGSVKIRLDPSTPVTTITKLPGEEHSDNPQEGD